MAKQYYDTIDIGDPVAPLTKPPITRVQIAKYAGASLDYSALHIDDDFAKSAGYGGVFAHGAISLGFAIEALSRWVENARVLRALASFQKLVWPGDIITAKGVVVQRYEKHGEARVDVDVWAENQNHDIVMKGSVTLVLWRNDKDEKKAKGIWPPVSSDTVKELRGPPPGPVEKRPPPIKRAREPDLDRPTPPPRPPPTKVPAGAPARAEPKPAPARVDDKKSDKKPATKVPAPAAKPAAKVAKKPEKADKKPAKPAAKKPEKKPAKPAKKPDKPAAKKDKKDKKDKGDKKGKKGKK